MIFEKTPLDNCYSIQLEKIGDDRGWFMRSFCKKEFSQIGHDKEWVQMNHSFTKNAGTIRGMHYQPLPFSEIKLVRCIAGKILDVVVDIRKNSATFMHWFSIELSAENQKMLYIPEGFAHGFQTLTDDCQLLYNHTAYYQKDAEAGIYYNDPALQIKWAMPVTTISDRDKNHPILNNFKGI